MYDIQEYLKQEQVSLNIIKEINDFIKAAPVPEELAYRIPTPQYLYYGKDVLEQAANAVLCEKNLLLTGSKATGKNVLAETLAMIFQRPAWDISFHVNMDAAGLIGMDTFKNGEVVFRKGPVYECAQYGGFGILDEINMAKNEALAVLHSALDFRRVIDVPGYKRIELNPATRFIGTMNYGYAGTRELNEALTSRFAVIRMPAISGDNLEKLLRHEFPDMTDKYVRQFSGLYMDLMKKAESAEISERALDLRGLLDSLSLMHNGLDCISSLSMCITNKIFDNYERSLAEDVIRTRISQRLSLSEIFSK